MGYNIKLVRTSEDGTREEHAQPWCHSYAVYEYLPGSLPVREGAREPGIVIEMTHADRKITAIGIDTDGESIFVESDQSGKTVNSFHWPPRNKRTKEMRA